MSLKVTSAGMFSSVQDFGRLGLRHLGIPWAGVGCRAWMRFANALLNQPENTPVIETIEAGLSITAVDKPVAVSVVGDVAGSLVQADGASSSLTGWRSYTLAVGDCMTIKRTGGYRCAIVGIKDAQLKSHFGSASTYANAALGGLDGNRLKAGDIINTAVGSNVEQLNTQKMSPFQYAGECDTHFAVRAVPGPQDDAFSEATLAAFFTHEYSVSSDIDRMGARLQGPAITHKSAQHKDLVSDAILPGSVQVPGIGTPIVMLADAHTVGGYPKIATVITADLALFALCRPGAIIKFQHIGAEDGRMAAADLEQSIQNRINTITPVGVVEFSSAQLLGLNLIDGVTDALNFDP